MERDQYNWSFICHISFMLQDIFAIFMEIFICSFHEEALIVTILTFLIIITYFHIFFLKVNCFKHRFNAKLTNTTINF